MLKTAWLVFVTMLTLVGCAATGPQFAPLAPAAESGVVYVYRLPRFANSGGYPQIKINGQERGALKNGGYLALKVEPGTNTVEQVFSIWNWDIRANPVIIEVKPGGSYYVRMDTDARVADTGHPTRIERRIWFGEVDAKMGLQEIKSLNLSE